VFTGGPPVERIRGRVFQFRAGVVERALAAIDEVERVADEAYRRVLVDTDEHGPVWAYEFVGVHRFESIVGGSWVDHVSA
jgi:gamma-glutamylcyclotransferase (GGCT)/AIG2-like uncharacterized protein YtfP